MLKSLSVRDKTKDFIGEMMSVICFKINCMPVFLSHFWFGTIPLLAYHLVPLKRRSPRCSYISILKSTTSFMQPSLIAILESLSSSCEHIIPCVLHSRQYHSDPVYSYLDVDLSLLVRIP